MQHLMDRERLRNMSLVRYFGTFGPMFAMAFFAAFAVISFVWDGKFSVSVPFILVSLAFGAVMAAVTWLRIRPGRATEAG